MVLFPSTIVPVSLIGFGVIALFGMFGRDEDEEEQDLHGIANKLDTSPDVDSIEQKIQDLSKAIDFLTSAADLDHLLVNPPRGDDSPVRKATALADELDRGRLEIKHGDGTGGGDRGPLQSAAEDVRREKTPSSAAALSLLSVVSGSDSTFSDAKSTLGESVDRLDEYERAVSTLEAIDPEGPTAAAATIRNELREENPLSGELIGFAKGVAGSEPRNDVADTVGAICLEIEEQTGISLSGTSSKDRARSLLSALNEDEIPIGATQSEVSEVAKRIRRDLQPERKSSRELLEALETRDEQTLESRLRDVIEELDASATTRSMLANVSYSEVERSAAQVLKSLGSESGPVADMLKERVKRLQGMVKNASDSNDVILYAVDKELTFYMQDLVPKLSGATSPGEADAAVTPETDELRARKQEVKERHVETKKDHNHSIPLHFLSLAESLIEEEDRLISRGQTPKAIGVHEATADLIDHVESLYEKNEYSVMLRRLRS